MWLPVNKVNIHAPLCSHFLGMGCGAWTTGESYSYCMVVYQRKQKSSLNSRIIVRIQQDVKGHWWFSLWCESFWYCPFARKGIYTCQCFRVLESCSQHHHDSKEPEGQATWPRRPSWFSGDSLVVGDLRLVVRKDHPRTMNQLKGHMAGSKELRFHEIKIHMWHNVFFLGPHSHLWQKLQLHQLRGKWSLHIYWYIYIL